MVFRRSFKRGRGPFSRRRFKKRRYRRKKRMSKKRYKLMKYVKLNMLQPKIYQNYNTAEFDASHGSQWNLVDSIQVDVGKISDYVSRLPLTITEFTGIDSAIGKGIVVGKHQETWIARNTSNDIVDLEIRTITPKVVIGEEMFTDRSVTLWDFPALVNSLMESENVNSSTRLGYNPEGMSNYRTYFKTLKRSKVCLKSGQTVKVHLHAKKFFFLNGDNLQKVGDYKNMPGVMKFLHIRAHGGIVHDTTSDGLVARGPVHLNLELMGKTVFYLIPTDKREHYNSYSSDTVLVPEAPLQDVQMEEVKEE